MPLTKRVSQVLDVDNEQAGPQEGSKTDQRLVLCAVVDACTSTVQLSLSS